MNKLQQLSDAASPGEWFAAVGSGKVRRKQQHSVLGIASMRGTGAAGALAVFASTDGRKADNAELCAALVNAFRAGELVPAAPPAEPTEPSWREGASYRWPPNNENAKGQP